MVRKAFVILGVVAVAGLVVAVLVSRPGSQVAHVAPAVVPATDSGIVSPQPGGQSAPDAAVAAVTKPAQGRATAPVPSGHRTDQSPDYAAQLRDLYGTPNSASRVSALLKAWASADFARALAWFESLPPNEDSAALFPVILKQWSQLDFNRAMDYAFRLMSQGVPVQSLSQFMTLWAQRDLEGITAFALQKDPESEARRQLMAIIGKALQWRDPVASMQWSEQLPSEDRQIVVVPVMQTWADQAPRDAADYVSGMLPGEAQDVAARVVVWTWCVKDAPAAAQWVSAFPEGDMRRDMLRAVVENWVWYDFDDVAAWVGSLPVDVSRDGAVRALAIGMARARPNEAAAWLEAIVDPAVREETAGVLADFWMRDNPEALRAMMMKK